jgi:hypothetical protein
VRSGCEARAPSSCVAGSLGSDGEGVLGPTVPIGFHQLPDAMKWQALAPRIFRGTGTGIGLILRRILRRCEAQRDYDGNAKII